MEREKFFHMIHIVNLNPVIQIPKCELALKIPKRIENGYRCITV